MADKTVYQVINEFKTEYFTKKSALENYIMQNEEFLSIISKKRKVVSKLLGCAITGEISESLNSELKELDILENNLRKRVEYIPRCSICGDSGFAGGKMCICLKNRIYKECFGAEDISAFDESFEKSDLSKFDDTENISLGQTQRSRYYLLEENAKAYIKRFPENKKRNLLLSGKTGLGKSFLLRCMAKELKNKNADVCFIKAAELMRCFFEHRMGREIELSYLENAQVLMIDDLGTEPMTQNVTVEYLTELLENRINKKKNTVFVTNLSEADIKKRYGDRIYSRMVYGEICHHMIFEGKDLRI